MADAPPAPEPSPAKKTVKKSTGVKKPKSEGAKGDSGFGSVEKIDQQPDASSSGVVEEGDHASFVPRGEVSSPERKKSSSASSKPPSARTSVSDQGSASAAPESKPTTATSSSSNNNDTTNNDPPPVNRFQNMYSLDELNHYKSVYESRMQEMQDRLSHEEDAAQNLSQSKRKLESDISNLKKDLENVELSLQKVSCAVSLF